MTIVSRWRSMVAWLWRRDRAEQGLDAELRAYVELSAADKVRDGVPPGEARRQAMLELGGIEAVKEQCAASGMAACSTRSGATCATRSGCCARRRHSPAWSS